MNAIMASPGGRAPPGQNMLTPSKNLVRLSKFAVLALQGLQLLGHVGRNARPLAAVDLRLLHPLQKRLRRAADLS